MARDGEQLAFPGWMDSPLLGKVKNERTLMVWSLFSLSKDKVVSLPPYDDGTVKIKVTGSAEHGVATCYDKDVLIYLASLLQDKLNRGETPSPTLVFTANDWAPVVGVRAAGTAYDRLLGALMRLKTTTVLTNIETGGEGEDSAFSWLSDYKVRYRRDSRTGEKVMHGIKVTLCDWVYRAVLRDRRMLTYDPAYFSLSPLERRLYEIARAHCGKQRGFKMGIEKLRLRAGVRSELKDFKRDLVKLSKCKNPLPGYGLSVIDPRKRIPHKDAPKPTGRTPLKAHMVFFYSTDRLAHMPTYDQTPDLSDADPFAGLNNDLGTEAMA
jgi:plasmid replication initiation protein